MKCPHGRELFTPPAGTKLIGMIHEDDTTACDAIWNEPEPPPTPREKRVFGFTHCACCGAPLASYREISTGRIVRGHAEGVVFYFFEPPSTRVHVGGPEDYEPYEANVSPE